MKKIFVIDWVLILIFALSAYTGIKLHMAGHGDSHEIWHNWAVFHVIVSTLFLIAGVCHVKMHWGWYKGVIKKGIGTKSRITLGVSVVFVLSVISGVILLSVDGANSGVGLWHYKIGLLTSVLAFVHILKRLPILRKSLVK